jgi:hypothetical protein
MIVVVSVPLLPVLANASSPPSSRPPLLFTQSRRVTNDDGKILTGSNLFRLEPDGTSIQLTHFAADELIGLAPTSLSPNQQQVIFSVSKDLLTDSIYRMNLDGSNLTRIVGDGLKGTAPVWSQDASVRPKTRSQNLVTSR